MLMTGTVFAVRTETRSNDKIKDKILVEVTAEWHFRKDVAPDARIPLPFLGRKSRNEPTIVNSFAHEMLPDSGYVDKGALRARNSRV
jgi:hypothetical protein